jgi:hypothetical protein
MQALPMATETVRGSQRPDCVADEAVGFEPVSNSKFRNNREKYRENRKFGLKFTTASPANAAAMRFLSESRYRN